MSRWLAQLGQELNFCSRSLLTFCSVLPKIIGRYHLFFYQCNAFVCFSGNKCVQIASFWLATRRLNSPHFASTDNKTPKHALHKVEEEEEKPSLNDKSSYSTEAYVRTRQLVVGNWGKNCAHFGEKPFGTWWSSPEWMIIIKKILGGGGDEQGV